MNIQDKITLMEARLARLDSRGDKNIKSPGVRKKLVRKLRKIKSET